MPAILLALIEDESAAEYFTYIYVNYKDAMYRRAYEVLMDEGRAEDAVHDALYIIAASDHKLKTLMEMGHGPKEKCFLAEMARQRAVNMVQSAAYRSEVSVEQNGPEEPGTEDFGPELSESEKLIAAAVRRLNPDYREIIMLLYYRDFTQEQAMRFTGYDAKTFQRKKSRAINRLRELVREMEGRDWSETQ